jgi:ubiquinone/menaquinone biosynthesis C-methylase UbiE
VTERLAKQLRHSPYIDGYIRRLPHEFGVREEEEEAYYQEVFRRMNIQPTDIVLDIGAGLGRDGLEIARRYRPEKVYILEPPGRDEEESAYKFLPLEMWMEQEGVKNIEPLMGFAEEIPLPDNRVSKVAMIHSAPAFTDLSKALLETLRVLKPDGSGVLVTNGANDKVQFRKKLLKMGRRMRSKAPPTVSSPLNYVQAYLALKSHFRVTDIYRHKGSMIITEDRLPEYIWQFGSYRQDFDPPDMNDGSWQRARKEIVEDRLKAEMAANGGVAYDTIDICAIYFTPRTT